jgi:predicted acetylornithine/succinylornithine family transaminase
MTNDFDLQFLLASPSRLPLCIHKGDGCYVYDADGRRYLDFVSGLGVNALGYNHPNLTKVLQEQAAVCVHTSGLYAHPYQGRLAEALCRLSGLDCALFTNSGAEAMEAALKLARCYGEACGRQKTRVVALRGSFHGRTRGALAVNGQASFHDPFAPYGMEVSFVEPDDLDGLEAAIDSRTAALVLEAVQGEGGVYPLSETFLVKAREVTRAHDALLIADECQCGLGRTGKYFAYQWAKITPDIVTVAKPLAGGLPLGAAVFTEAVRALFPAGMHGSTFAGGPLACRMGLEFLMLMPELLAHVRLLGEMLRAGLIDMQRRYPVVRAIRSKALMLGIELQASGDRFVRAALQRGLLINCTQERVLRLLPPFILTEEQAKEGLRILDEVLAQGESGIDDSLKPHRAGPRHVREESTVACSK